MSYFLYLNNVYTKHELKKRDRVKWLMEDKDLTLAEALEELGFRKITKEEYVKFRFKE